MRALWLGALLAVAAPASAAADATVTAGALTAHVASDPFRLTFTQRGGETLQEVALGAATHAVSMRTDSAAVVADVATSDPAKRLTIRIEPDRGGVIAVRATGATRVAFAAPETERFYGLGERSTGVDLRGQDIENYTSDGPFPRNTRPFVSATIPPQGYRARDDATYYPVPWMLSSRGYGVLLDNDETSTFHLATEPKDAWSAEAPDAPALAVRVFAGPTPAAALARFTAATGRQPPPVAGWQFGPWFQTGQSNTIPLADEAAYLDKLQKADAPVSVAETQMHYLPCGADRENADYEAQRVAAFHAHGLAILTYVNPMVCASYSPLFEEAAAAGALQRNAAGQPATFNSFVGGAAPLGFTVQPVASFDFSSPAGAAVYRTVLDRVLAAGHDGWMEDFGEYTPTDTQPRDATTPAQMHNRFPTQYHCAVAALAPRVVRFQRSGWTGAARCAANVWGGDPTTTFGFDGLSSAVKQALGMGMSGISRWGSDIGGYDTLGDDPRLTPELLKRWIEFGAVSGVMRTKASGIAIPSYTRPQIWDPGIVEVWRRYAKLHTQLYPYLLAADARYRETGLPLMRALVLLAPGDRRAQAVEDELGFGDDLLAAPVVTEGATHREVYLPRGRWLDWSRSVRYDPRDGSHHVAGATAIEGPATRDVRAAPDELPLFLRAGTILPLLSPTVSTLYKNIPDRLVLLAFPRGHSTSRAFERDRFDSRVRRGSWTLAIRGTRARSYTLEASTADLRFVPCRVTVGRKRVRFAFDRRRRILRTAFTARSATLRAVRCS